MAFQKGRKKTGGVKKGFTNKFTPAAIQRMFNKVKKDHEGVSILEHLCNQAYVDNTLAMNLLKKLLADKHPGEVERRTEGEWADRTPREIVEEMDQLTLGEKPGV